MFLFQIDEFKSAFDGTFYKVYLNEIFKGTKIGIWYDTFIICISLVKETLNFILDKPLTKVLKHCM